MQYDLARVRELNSAIDPLPVERNGKRGGEGKKKRKKEKNVISDLTGRKNAADPCVMVYICIYIYIAVVFFSSSSIVFYTFFFFSPSLPCFCFYRNKMRG